MPKALTEQQIESYRRDGFLLPIRVMSEDAAATFSEKLLAARADGQLRVKGGQTKINLLLPWVHEFATDDRLLDVVEDLLGPDLMIYHSTLWAKQPRAGEYVSWHQDNTYFGHDPCEVLSVWLALTPATVETGCMQYLPGTGWASSGCAIPTSMTATCWPAARRWITTCPAWSRCRWSCVPARSRSTTPS
ncbi:MAG: hypothetical protein GEU92_08675 [Alphaproteobacteria bacterium]|nr:hypothetical protein [Alphaproteobacteria bacterium]